MLRSDGFSAREKISSSSILETIYYAFEPSSPSKFKVEDNVVNFNEFWTDMEFHFQVDFLSYRIWKSGFRPFEDITDTLRFVRAWNGLVGRSTTMPEDVHTILVTIMGRSPAELLKIPRSERMKAILRVQTLLPLSLLFTDGPKLLDHGIDRWIPAYPEISPMDLQHGVMRTSDDGLIIESSGVSLFSAPFPNIRVRGFVVKHGTPRLEKLVLLDSGTKSVDRAFSRIC